MAICRWSDEDFTCDFYIYESSLHGEIQVEIAGNHLDHDVKALGPWPESPSLEELVIKPPTPLVQEWAKAYRERNNALRAAMDAAKRTPIDHPYAGRGFHFKTPDEVVEFLEKEIIPSGKFNVPEWLIDSLKNWELIGDGSEDEGTSVL